MSSCLLVCARVHWLHPKSRVVAARCRRFDGDETTSARVNSNGATCDTPAQPPHVNKTGQPLTVTLAVNGLNYTDVNPAATYTYIGTAGGRGLVRTLLHFRRS